MLRASAPSCVQDITSAHYRLRLTYTWLPSAQLGSCPEAPTFGLATRFKGAAV